MRHKKVSRRFSRTSSHRMAMMRNLAISLIEHEIIKTTVEKAKELRRFLEPLITKSKTDNLHSRRVVMSKLNSKDAVRKLFSSLGPRFNDTKGGYLRIIKAGFRAGDRADICFIEFTHRVIETEVKDENLDNNSIESNLNTKPAAEEKPAAEKKPSAEEKPAKKQATKKKTPVGKKETEKPVVKKPTTKKKSTTKDKPKENWWSRFFK